MKKISRIIAVLSCVALLAGCGGNNTDRVQTDGKNFTYWTSMDGYSMATLQSYSDMMFYQELEKRTGVHIDFIHPIEGSTGNEAFITMLSSEEMPDMIEYTWLLYSGGPQQALDDEVIISLNDYMQKHAPSYYDYMEGDKGKEAGYSYKLQATTDDGRYYGFNVLNIGETKGFAGLYTRADLLEKWGMDLPETIDEWEAVFAKAKSEGFSKPFTSTLDVISFKSSALHSFNTAYNVGKSMYLEGNKVVFGPFEKGYKEYVAQMADWVKKGYLDSGFVTNDNAKIESNMTNGTSMTTHGYVGSGIGKILPAAQAKDPSYDLVACVYPVAKKGDVAEFQMMYQDATTLAIGISTTCGNYEKAIEWCDYIYSDEGVALQLFGIEGDTYTVENIDGKDRYIYTDKILDYEAGGFNSLNEAMYHYLLPCNHPGYNQHSDYLYNYYQVPQQIEAIETWNVAAEKALAHRLPNLSYTEDESAEITDIKEIAQADLEVNLCDIILGKKTIDTFDAAIAQAKADGYDRWIEICQDAYDRYVSKK